MKVSTDACIQGALAAAFCQEHKAEKALDIGAGTGLLSLMMVQQNPALQIDALELDEAAYEQALENSRNSPWSNRIRLWHTAVQEFKPASDTGYDFIVCNPPFFHNHLQAAQQQRNQARHSISLTKEELATAVRQLLAPGGYCCIMYPVNEWEAWHEAAMQEGLQVQELHYIKPTPGKAPNRIVGYYGKIASAVQESELVIYSEPQVYSPAFRQLLHPYYLHL